MAQMMFQDSGQDGRSVLGMLAVQVERDPKTGVSVVRSVAPMSPPGGAPNVATIFDDGRKSIHAVGGSVGQPSSEELGQILSAIDGVGMKVLLDDVTVNPNEAEMVKTGPFLEEKVLSFSSHVVSKEEYVQKDSSGCDSSEAKMTIEKCSLRVEDKADEVMMVVRDTAGQTHNIEGQRLEEDPVTLLFLGYADGTAENGPTQEEQECTPIVERVIITEDGEEHVLGPEGSDSPRPGEAEPGAGNGSREEAEPNIPAAGSGAGVKAEGQEGDKGKRKPCRCCSIM
ncbi:uncharacterized protein ACNS7B_009633 isoform 1-T2 [Menidia menidia]